MGCLEVFGFNKNSIESQSDYLVHWSKNIFSIFRNALDSYRELPSLQPRCVPSDMAVGHLDARQGPDVGWRLGHSLTFSLPRQP